MDEGLLSKIGTEQNQSCKKKKAEEELLHNINLEALKKETNLSLDEIAVLSGISDSKNLGKWSQGKPNGSRPNYNAIVRLLQKGATVETLFGVDYAATHQPAHEPAENREPIDYQDPKFLAALEKGMALIEARKKQGIVK